MIDFFDELYRIILLENATEKCEATHSLAAHFLSKKPDSLNDGFELNHKAPVNHIQQPGYPKKLTLVAPRELKRRGIQNQQGRNVLLHAIAHIEFNAINLALDAAYRFRHQPSDYYRDWIKIADDEARHFGLLSDYLNRHSCTYSDYPAHNGLWDMAVATANDIVARMALVPRVLEARGLDVTPGMIKRLQGTSDHAAVEILEHIYQDEIGHVETGSRWFFHHCQKRDLEPRATFLSLVEKHLHGQLRGPFNVSARLQAGFDEMEMHELNARYQTKKSP